MIARAAILCALLVLSACAGDPAAEWSTVPTYTDSVQTVAVPILKNDSPIRDVEFELTAAIISEIQKSTPYKIVPEASADSVLTGRIRRVELRQLSKSTTTGLTEEGIVSVSIDFQWKDLRANRTMIDLRDYTGQGLYLPSRPNHESVELGQFAAVQKLARDVVARMRDRW